MALSVKEIERLMAKSDGELLDEIGALTLKTLEDEPGAERLAFSIQPARDLGSAIFQRLHKELHSLICGGAQTDEEREKLKKMLSLDAAGMSVALATLLVSQFAVSPTIAAIVALLAVKKFIQPAGEEFCEFWAKNT